MGESEKNIVKAKIRGYIKTIKVLSAEVSRVTEPAQEQKKLVLQEAEKEDGALANIENELISLETIARQYGALSIDIERYLFKLGTMIFILEDLGEVFEPDLEEDTPLVNSAKEHATDKNSFIFGSLDDKCVVINEELSKDMHNDLENIRNNKEYLNERFQQVKSRLIQQKS